jgi:hypothetical protein
LEVFSKHKKKKKQKKQKKKTKQKKAKIRGGHETTFSLFRYGGREATSVLLGRPVATQPPLSFIGSSSAIIYSPLLRGGHAANSILLGVVTRPPPSFESDCTVTSLFFFFNVFIFLK